MIFRNTWLKLNLISNSVSEKSWSTGETLAIQFVFYQSARFIEAIIATSPRLAMRASKTGKH
jgi:hypothetical protein